jgi:hypothetical protein
MEMNRRTLLAATGALLGSSLLAAEIRIGFSSGNLQLVRL